MDHNKLWKVLKVCPSPPVQYESFIADVSSEAYIWEFKVSKVQSTWYCNFPQALRLSLVEDCIKALSSVQFSSVTQLCPTPCNPMNCSTPGLPVNHQLPEFTQIHVHRFMALRDVKKDQFRFHSFAKCRPFWSNTVRAISSGLLFA